MQHLTASSFQLTFVRYLVKFSPVLIAGLISYLGVFYILMMVEPASLQHVWLTNSYAPLVLLAALGHFGVFSFLLVHPRRGVIVSVVLSIMLFLQLQGLLDQSLVVKLVMGGILAEVSMLTFIFCWKLLKKKLRQRFARQENPHFSPTPDTTGSATSSSPTAPSRRRGRQRKYRFFGQ